MAVGSPEWCQAAEGMKASLVQLGRGLIQAAGAKLPEQDSNLWGILENIIPGVGLIPSRHGPAIWQEIKSVVDCWVGTVKAVAPCDAGSLLAVAVVLAVLKILRQLRMGWDAALWSTVDIEARIEPLERICVYLLESICPTEIPNQTDAMECLLRGTIGREQYVCWMLVNGCHPAAWEPVLQARRERLNTNEVIDVGWRQGYDVTQFANALQSLGWTDPKEIGDRLSLHWELPTIADILHFLTRNVYDTSYVQDYRLDEGFEERFWANYGPVCEQIGLSHDLARQHYWAHWITASPGQLREFVHRLRPGAVPENVQFTTTDYTRLLAEQDVAPYVRDRFLATVYNVPALSYVQDMHRNYTVSDDELRGIHLSLGFSPEDAERFLKVDIIRRARIRASEAHGWTTTALAHAWVSGNITDDFLAGEMTRLGFTDDESSRLMARSRADLQYTSFTRARSRAVFAMLSEVKSAVTVGVMDAPTAIQALTGAGWPQGYATGWVQVTQAAARTAVIKQGVSQIRSSYYRGEVSVDQAGILLQQLGIVPDAIRQYLSLWAVKLTRKRKTLSKAEIIKELCAGHISTGDAIARLGNLGYDGPDIELYLGDAGQCIAQRKAKAEGLAARQAATESRELLKLQKQAAAQSKSLLREAEKAEPVSKLVKWAAMGVIDGNYFVDRLARYGYDNGEITHYWSEAVQRKNSAAEPVDISNLLPSPSKPEPGTVMGGGP